MNNRITVYNIKGGTGKTRIALNLALTLEWGIVTNDEYSITERVMSSSKLKILSTNESLKKYLSKIPDHIPLIFDMGGRADNRAVDAMRQSDYVIMPVMADRGDLPIGLNFLQEMLKINPNIIIVVNQTKSGQFQQVSRVFQKYYPKLPLFEIKTSTAMSRIVTEKRSITEIMKSNSLLRHHYQIINQQFQAIIEYMQITEG